MRRLKLPKNDSNKRYLGTVQTHTLIEKKPLKDTGLEWIKINGLSNEETIVSLLDNLRVEPLWIEDVFHVHQRTKVETNQNHMYFVFNGSSQSNPSTVSKYIQLIVLEDTIITLSETAKDVLDELFYSEIDWNVDKSEALHRLLDGVIDFYLELELTLSSKLLEIEEDLLDENHQSMTKLHQLRKELYVLKTLSQTLVDPLYKKVIQSYLVETPRHETMYNDWFDHIFRLNMQTAEDREMIHQMMDLYNTNLSNKMNGIMKTLTIFSAIFIPLSFLAGVFGMNFTDMPILTYEDGFLWFLGLSGIIMLFMLLYFKLKDWL